MRKTSIIIPCYNEALRLNCGKFLGAAKGNENLHFLFVNDGSTDGTGNILDELRAANPGQISCIFLEKNSGKAEAVRRGILMALEGDFANIGYWDADLATPLDVIPRFCEILDSSDYFMVLGSRVRLLGRSIERNNSRHYLGRIFASCASMVLKLPVYDTQCGAKLFKNLPHLGGLFQHPFRVRWTFDVEIMARHVVMERLTGIPPLKLTAFEYPLSDWKDVPGSKLKPRDFIRGGWELWKIFLFIATERQKDLPLRNKTGSTTS